MDDAKSKMLLLEEIFRQFTALSMEASPIRIPAAATFEDRMREKKHGITFY